MARALTSAVLCCVGLPCVGLGSLSGCSFDFDAYDPRAGAGGAARSVTASTAASASSTQQSSTAAATGGASGNGGEGGTGPQTIAYAPTVADCVYAAAPDPAVCLAAQPGNTVGVDLSSGTAMNEIHTYLRFDFDDRAAGKQVTAVTLELTVYNDVGSNSGSSGIVYEVSSFTHQSLSGTLPMAMMQLAGDQGLNMLGRTVQWTLPATSVTPNGSLMLGILPVVTDGVDYDNLLGTVPPRLLVTVE